MDIRDLGHLVSAWPEDSNFIYTRTSDPNTLSGYRIYLAKRYECKVLGSFPSISTAAREIAKFKQLAD